MVPIVRSRPGTPAPLGATWDGSGVGFALYSEEATSVTLCLYDAAGEETRIPLRHRSDFVWHAYTEGIAPGQRYGYRVDGPWDPAQGLRFNPRNVLLDPYARALDGGVDWKAGAFSYDVRHPDADLARATDDQRGAPLGVVVDPTFDWGTDTPPNTPLQKTLVYEAHVRGTTMRHPAVPAELRGTYLGLSSEPILRHLRELGVTAVQLMPVHAFVDDQALVARGLRNYWGYGPIGFFAPEPRYRADTAIGDEVAQFKRMVKAFHAEGIEVILDVAYDRTAEGNQRGPALSFRGIDNRTYYRLQPGEPRRYFDYAGGTGNALNVSHPQTLQLIMDSLRYWVQEMHVDGFRIDVAAILARGLFDADRLATFFSVIHQDPVIGRVKLIAEPWSVGGGGYQVGRFPVKWAEANARLRHAARAFWRGDRGTVRELASSLTGSVDPAHRAGGGPATTVNFVVAHDGFTLHDLVSYERKHNEANGEGNADGPREELSWNCGVEGETDDAMVRRLRARQARNLLATLLFSAGTPMICGGDEIGRTQRGNDNAYCLDDETSWIDWELDDERRRLLAFTRRLTALRRDHPILRRSTTFGASDEDVRIRWLRQDGAPMGPSDWANELTSSLGMLALGSGLPPFDEDGELQTDDDVCLLVNASAADLRFALPAHTERGRAAPWTLLVDTSDDGARESLGPGETTTLPAHSTKLFARQSLGPGGLEATRGTPPSTYRLQLQGKFGFRDAAAVLEYLHRLGAGAVYSAPILRASRGSTHGYDVVDHAAINPELGTTDEFRAWTDAMATLGVGYVLDFVPNHVGIGSGENAWWIDVLENGPSSLYADFFDIEWRSTERVLRSKVLLPVLGSQFGQEVAGGKLAVARDGGALWVTYYDRKFPAAPRSYVIVLERALSGLALPEADRGRMELESIAASLRHLPDATTVDAFERKERAREKEVIKRRIGALCEAHPAVGVAIDDALRAISVSPELLERFLGEQNYRLSYWRVATDEINYRRFFDINELAAIRMEDAAVFDAAHALVLALVAEGRVTALRLDHTDGLYDPQGYFRDLQRAIREARAGRGQDDDGAPTYVVAEKILEAGEELPRTWAISGTTGYDFLGAVNALWVDPASERAMTELYARFTDDDTHYPRVIRQAKRDVMEETFSGEIQVLGHALKRIAEATRTARDFTLAGLVKAVREVIASLDVYRTYVRQDGSREAEDGERVARAVTEAQRQNPLMEPAIFEFLREVLLLENHSDAAVRFAMRFQQLTGPIMAKGVEDTALYRYNRLVCLNEVGSDPSRFGVDATAFHAHNAAILARWPLSMTTTTTHDTKRSEDVRARLAVLTEFPDRWAAFVEKLESATQAFVGSVGGLPAPSRGDVYLFAQTAVGVWPFEGARAAAEHAGLSERLTAYMGKAVREAKVRSSWTFPNAAYDDAVRRFVDQAMGSTEVVAALDDLVRSIATYGASNALAQVALRLAAPGVPDVYQGCELWKLALVDPDNRAPVDFAHHRAALGDLVGKGRPTPSLARELVRSFADGRIKLHLTHTGLALRRSEPALFLEGAYDVIDGGEHVVAFERSRGARRLVCVVPRLVGKLTRGAAPWPLGEVWGERRITLAKSGRFENVLTGDILEGASFALGRVLADFPVAWLWAK